MSDPDDKFEALHEALTEQLLARIRSGEATAADLNVARQWLNDNNVAANPAKNKGLKALGESITKLPFDAPN